MGRMRRDWTLRAFSTLLVAIGAWLPATGTWAQEDQAYLDLTTPVSEVELGFQYVSQDSFKFGEYTGFEEEGFTVLGNVDIQYRSPLDNETSHYFRLRGLNLGLDSLSVDAEYKNQGRFGLSFLFDELPKFQTDSSSTIFEGTGSTVLTLPSGWAAGNFANEPDLSTSIETNLRKYDIDHERRRLGGGLSVVLPWNFEFEADYVHETKRGDKLMGAVIGRMDLNGRSVILPERIDYDTDRFETTLRYTGEDFQAQIQYLLSSFNNDEEFQSWENPYSGVGGWDPSAAFQGDSPIAECIGVSGCGTGRLGQMPDNWFHQIQASGGYNLPYNTRVTVNTAFGWMKQDDDFLPFTVNEALSVTNPLPRDSLDAEIHTTVVDARIASRPLPKLRMNLTYRYDDRDNETPRDVYVYVQGDSEDQQASMFDGNARINRPYSYTHHKVEFETGYRILKRTEMTVGYRWDQIKRDFQETKRTRENTISARLRSQPWSFLSARLHYERSWRDPASYDGTDPLEISENLSDPASFDPDTDFENHPLLRKFYLASRERDKLTAMVTVTPLESLSIAFNMNWINDDYNHTEIGLTDQQILSPGVDISFAPTQRVMAHVFYTFEKIKSQQNGWSFLGFVPDWEDPDRRWSGDDEDKVHTVGCGFDLVVLEDQFSIGADYLYVRSRGKTDMTLGSGVASSDPDNPDLAFDKVISTLHTVNVHGDYKLTENLSTRLGYTYANLESNDWAFHGVTPTTINRVIATGQESPDYTEHVVAWSLTYAF